MIGFNNMPSNEVWNHEKFSDQDIYYWKNRTTDK